MVKVILFIKKLYHLSKTRLNDHIIIGYKIDPFHYQKPNVISWKSPVHSGKSGTWSVGEIDRENKRVRFEQ